MSTLDWKPVGTALLGSWPAQVAGWGREGIAAYVAELERRGVRPEDALGAIRSCDGEFPPSAGRLAALARRDPSAPSFAEAFTLIFGRGGLLSARPRGAFATDCQRRQAEQQAVAQRAATLHPLIAGFARAYGVARLRQLQVDEPEYGGIVRRDLQREWEEFVAATDRRHVAALTAGGDRRDGLRGLDPLAALGAGRRELVQPHRR